MTTLPPIEVRAYGSGAREVVLLHGGPGAPGYMAPLARELARDQCVLEPLQRRAGDVPVTVAQHVADLAEVAPERALLVGSSWGAMLALSYGSAHPERVRGICLVGCGTYDPESRRAYQVGMAVGLERVGAARVAELAVQLEAAGSREEEDDLFGRIGDLATRAQAHEPLTADSEVVRADRRGHLETWDDVMRLQAEGVEPAAFSRIGAPVLMIHGDADPHPGAATRDRLREQMPQLEYVELERCGHIPWIERQAREPFLLALRNWLDAFPPPVRVTDA